MSYRCVKCETSYSNKSNLIKHLRRFHPKDVSKLAPLHYKKNSTSPDSKIRCNICAKTFNHRQSLRRHLMKTHISDPSSDQTLQSEIPVKNLKKCPLCDYGASFRNELLEHFLNVHDIPLLLRNLNFSSMTEFNHWKEETENETNSRFVIKNTETFQSHKSIHYACHRSGNYVPEGKGFRHLKKRGSCKINAYCPASIKVIMENAGDVKVIYLESHIGHDLDIGHLHLTKSERDSIASKIAANIPFDEILDGIRDSMTDNNSLKRIHLLTKKDLFNIGSRYNLCSSPQESEFVDCHENDETDAAQLDKQPKTESSIEERQQSLLMQFQEILYSGHSHETLDAIENVLNSLPPTLAAIDNNDNE